MDNEECACDCCSKRRKKPVAIKKIPIFAYTDWDFLEYFYDTNVLRAYNLGITGDGKIFKHNISLEEEMIKRYGIRKKKDGKR